jgi:hypothetical protein
MFHQLEAMVIVLGLAYATYKLVELFVRRRERMAIIEKMSLSDGAVIPPDITKWFTPPAPASWALRLGLLLSGLGLGLGVAVMMNFNMGDLPNGNALYFALMMLFGGAGLVVAYLIEQKNRKKQS